MSLNKRLEFFESNWAFFAGFGMSTVHDLPTTSFVHILSICFDLIPFACVCGKKHSYFQLVRNISMIMDNEIF